MKGTNSLDKQIVHFLLGMFFVSLLVSMAGIEITSGLIMASLIVIFFRSKSSEDSKRKLGFPSAIGVDWFVLLLVIAATISLVIHNDYNPDRIREFTPLRWVFLLYALVYAFQFVGIEKEELWMERFFLLTMAIGLYAFFQANSGIDIVRWDNRAVQLDNVDRFPYFRASGFFSNPMTYGHSSAMWASLAFAFLLTYRKEKKWFWLGGLSVFCILVGLFSCYTRGSWIAAFFGLFFVSIIKNWRWGITFVIIAVGAGCILAFIDPPFGERVLSIFDFKFNSNLSRLHIWSAHYAIFKDYPWFGSGMNYNPYLLDKYYEALQVPTTYRQIGHAHNNYLQWLAGTGVVGLTTYLLFIGSSLFLSLREYFKCDAGKPFIKAILLGSVGGQIAFHFGGLTECNFRDAEVKSFYLTLIAIALAVRLQRKNQAIKL